MVVVVVTMVVVRRLKHFPSFSLSLPSPPPSSHPPDLKRGTAPHLTRVESICKLARTPTPPYPISRRCIYIYIKRTIVEIGWDPAKRGFLRLGSRIESNSIGKEGEKDRFINGEMDRSIDRWSEIWKRGLALHRTRAIKDRPNFPPGFRVADRTRASCYRRYCVHEQSRN